MMSSTTSPTVYFENAAGRLLEEPAGFLRVVWTMNERGPRDARALFTHMLQALQRHNWSRILIDQRTMRSFSGEEQAWVAREWLPRAVHEGGYRHGAVLVSPDVMVRLATAFVTTQIRGLSVTYRSFEQEPQAVEWLLQQPGTPGPAVPGAGRW